VMIVHMIGNAHIDPVWLWRWQASVDEALATFRSAADRCDEYPEFIFTRGEAWLYQQVEKIDPALFARVRQLVERGQWHITGGQYIQPDSNLPTEMGWRRQVIHGRRYFGDRFGVEPTIVYNVDSFGHPATLPDILASMACRGFVFHRPNAQQVSLPAPAFRWRGPGGGEVYGFRITPAYVTHSDNLYGQIMLSVDAADPSVGHTMCFYGVGNHGGGPTKGNIEYILAHKNAFPGIELRFSTPQAFFAALAENRDKLPVVTEELQHTFPGCYSVMHDIKQRQRHAEHLLDQCERIVDKLVVEPREKQSYRERLDAAWDDLLFTEFHDTLAGTSIPSAWESVRALQGRARIIGEEIATEATRRWARHTLPSINQQQIVALNPDDASWEGLVDAEPFLDFDAWGDRWLSDLDGHPLDFQLVQPEAQMVISRVLVPARIPGGGSAQILIRTDTPTAAREIATDLAASTRGLSNARLRVDVDSSGIRRLTVDGQDVLSESGIGLHLRQDHTDTWTFHDDKFRAPVETVFQGQGWIIEERGPLRAVIHTDGWLHHSWVRWTLALHRDDPRVRMKLEVNFSERFKVLQMPISLASSITSWADGQAGGQVERASGPTEWPVQGWSRVDVPGKQLALITSDAYSLSVEHGCWQWTLLRSPKMAWGGGEPDVYSGRDVYTDQGMHTFDFILLAGDRLDNEALRREVRQHVQPLIVFDRYEGLNRPPWGNNPPRRLWTGAEQRARADGEGVPSAQHSHE